MLETNLISFSSKEFDKMKLLSDFMCYRSTLAIKNKSDDSIQILVVVGFGAVIAILDCCSKNLLSKDLTGHKDRFPTGINFGTSEIRS